jgi:PAP_fibrillin
MYHKLQCSHQEFQPGLRIQGDPRRLRLKVEAKASGLWPISGLPHRAKIFLSLKLKFTPLSSMSNRLILKQKLIETIAAQHAKHRIADNTPVTDNKIEDGANQDIQNLTSDLEQKNPFPRPLFYSPNLLQGIWKLLYANAREIRSLTRLPLGFELDSVYQVIDVPSGSFLNQAFCHQKLARLAGYVNVTAEFKVAPSGGDGLPDRRIDVFFQKRSIFIERIFGFTPSSDQPWKNFDARNPAGRQPYLNVTYLDEDLRIGRGGEGSLFILTRAEEMVR